MNRPRFIYFIRVRENDFFHIRHEGEHNDLLLKFIRLKDRTRFIHENHILFNGPPDLLKLNINGNGTYIRG